jgi:hypothetical protein
MRKTILFLAILTIAVSAFGLKPVIKTDPNSKVILVAIMKDTDTTFKNALVDSLVAHYGAKYQVKKIVIGKAAELNSQKYHLLIVMDQLKAWLAMNGQTKAIMKAAGKTDVVYFMTSGDKKWHWKKTDVYHIASASDKSFFPKAWRELRFKLDIILK